MIFKFNRKGFTLLELLVAVAVTVARGLAIEHHHASRNHSNQGNGDLEQPSRSIHFGPHSGGFAMRCLSKRRKRWLAATILEDYTNSAVWEPAERGKPPASLR